LDTKRPFRFGVVAESAPSRDQWIALVRKTEDLGYATFLLADHYVNEFPPIAALMSAADATSTLRVATIVFDNDFRHPALLAKEVATLDLLSGGRFELGIGAGWHRPEYEHVGIPFDPAGVRISRMEEALQIIRQFFTEDTVTFKGDHYTITHLKALPKPAQRPHPPIFIGGGGKRLLTIAGREADIVGLHLRVKDDGTVDPSERTEAAITRKIDWVRQAAGERFNAIELNILISQVVITENRQRAAEQFAREHSRPGTTADQLLANPYWLFGSVDQISEQIQRLRELFGISYFVVGDDSMETFAPVVARLAGR
jgi:probable F420-dependent oxidoreductase